MVWKHSGGGCMMGDAGEFPCDDSYRNIDTNETVTFETTREAHFKMPHEVEKLSELSTLEGVGKDDRLCCDHESKLCRTELGLGCDSGS